MTYTKPQLLGYSAIVAIQSSTEIKKGMNTEPNSSFLTTPAYEADE